MFNETLENLYVGINGQKVNDLCDADDTVVIAELQYLEDLIVQHSE